MKIAVIGSGAWGTALAIRLCKNGHDVTLWTFEKDLISEMETTRRNPRLPGAVQETGRDNRLHCISQDRIAAPAATLFLAVAQHQMPAQFDLGCHFRQSLLADHVRAHPGQFTLGTVGEILI